MQEKVLVVLFGWMGAHNKHVQKYADWWAGYGCDTIITCGTAYSTFFPPETKRRAQVVVNQMQEYVNKNPNCKIIFHSFSNGGGFLLAQALHLIQNKNYTQIRTAVCAHVLDSMLNVYIISALRAFLALRMPIYINILFCMLFPIIMLLGVFTNFYKGNFSAYTLNNTPTHVIYSTGDTICLPHEIEYFIDHLRAHSIPTTSHKFRDSAHVSHFRAHPEEYAQSVAEFVRAQGIALDARKNGAT